MIEQVVVGDIGSTKSSWWVSDREPREINLPGYNPVAHSLQSGKDMIAALSGALSGMTPASIWYYGAGIVDEQFAALTEELIREQFPETKIYVKSDLQGAALALCENKPGTIAILGTGSHAAVFDGKNIIRQANSLGYILGDEGGGSDIGRSLLQSFYYNTLPEEIRPEMENRLKAGRSGFLKELYSSPFPNQYLASFAQVAVIHQHNEWILDLIRSRLNLFLKNHLLPLKPIEPVHVLGSIGCIFAGLIKKEFSSHSLQAGTFLKDPSYRLFTIHSNHEFEKE
jgi:hypothetical protein